MEIDLHPFLAFMSVGSVLGVVFCAIELYRLERVFQSTLNRVEDLLDLIAEPDEGEEDEDASR